MKLPWVKWFPADWFSDPEIRRLPLIAKGLWHEALMAMMLSDAFELTGTPQELSRVIGCSISDFNEAFRHLLRYRACDCHAAPDGSVTLMSRRLKRLANSRQAAALRKHKQRSHAPCHAEVPSASASASVIEGIGVQGKGVTFWSVVSQEWLPKWRQNGSDYSEQETRTAFLALEANGWMWGRNPVIDREAALERQIQTDRKNRYGNQNSTTGNRRNDGMCPSKNDYAAAAARRSGMAR